jgi:hypothetical protein
MLPLLAFALPAFAQTSSLPYKETLYYDIEWRLITAGRARVDWSAVQRPRDGWRVNMHLESVGLVSKLFKVEDDYSATLSPSLSAQAVQIVAHEGSRQRETSVTYDRESHKATYLERDRVKNAVVLSHEIDIPNTVHDVIGGLYYLRTLNLEPGESAQAPISDGKKCVMARVEAQQREDIKTPAGTFKAVRYEVFLFNNVLYRRPAHLYVWLSEDRRRLPVQIRVRMQFTIGTITLQLAKHE